MVISAMPATATRSPGPAESTGTRVSCSVRNSSTTLVRVIVPSTLHQATCLALLDRALHHPHSARRPRYGVGVEVGDPRLERRAFGGTSGAGIVVEHALAAAAAEVVADDVAVEVERGPAVATRAVDDRELELVVAWRRGR